MGNVRLSYRDANNNGTVEAGEITEESNYYPFGMKHTGYNDDVLSINIGQKIKYNGKELQDELGLNVYDYGWRQYDPAIGRFNRIDRFAEKYYEKTPYNYAANNPVYYVDVAGDSLYVTHRRGFLGLGGKETLKYENGNLYNSDGSAYAGKVNGFLKKTMNALEKISQGQEGADMINELQSSDNTFTIEKGSSEFQESDKYKAHANQFATDPTASTAFSRLKKQGVDFSGGSGGTVFWNPSGSFLHTTNGMTKSSNTDLAHEMFHGLDANRGLLDNRMEKGVRRQEWQAVYRENNLRIQLGLPARTHYQTIIDGTGKKGPYGPRMLTPANQPIKPSWYK